MSFCRFGPKSDLYAYESDQGFVIHFASNRIKDVSRIPDIDTNHGTRRMMFTCHKQIEMMRSAENEFITLPFVGETFIFETLIELLYAMMGAQKIGYRVPEFALEAIQNELLEEYPMGDDRPVEVRRKQLIADINSSLSGRLDDGSPGGAWPAASQGPWAERLQRFLSDTSAPSSTLRWARSH